jgi:hypothetical protein
LLIAKHQRKKWHKLIEQIITLQKHGDPAKKAHEGSLKNINSGLLPQYEIDIYKQ